AAVFLHLEASRGLEQLAEPPEQAACERDARAEMEQAAAFRPERDELVFLSSGPGAAAQAVDEEGDEKQRAEQQRAVEESVEIRASGGGGVPVDWSRRFGLFGGVRGGEGLTGARDPWRNGRGQQDAADDMEGEGSGAGPEK